MYPNAAGTRPLFSPPSSSSSSAAAAESGARLRRRRRASTTSFLSSVPAGGRAGGTDGQTTAGGGGGRIKMKEEGQEANERKREWRRRKWEPERRPHDLVRQSLDGSPSNTKTSCCVPRGFSSANVGFYCIQYVV